MIDRNETHYSMIYSMIPVFKSDLHQIENKSDLRIIYPNVLLYHYVLNNINDVSNRD